MQLILVSHGNLAKGMAQTLAMIIGEQSNITALAAYNDDKIDVTQQLKQAIITAEQQHQPLVILTDIFGGSVNNEATQLLLQYPHVFVIAGMNLALTLALATHDGAIDAQQIKQLVQESQASIVFVNDQLNTVQEEDEL